MEGPTSDPSIVALRERQKRNLLATLFFSHGVPMLLAGDELGRSQAGNNNAYCHDSELSWMDWNLDEAQRALLHFAAEAIRLRKAHPALRTTRHCQHIAWLTPQGGQMSEADWALPFARCVGAHLPGDCLPERDARGRPVTDDDLLLLFNAHDGEIAFALPQGRWRLALDTAGGQSGEFEERYLLPARAFVLLLKPRSSAPARKDA